MPAARRSTCPEGVNRGIVGGAFDYRLRYLFDVTPATRFVAASRGRDHADWQAFRAKLDATVARLSPVGRRLDSQEENELNRYCWVLAVFDSHFRMGSGRGYKTPIDALGPSPGVDALLALAPPAGLEDLAGLMARLHASELAGLVGQPAHLNPTFAGSGLVGGADADLVVDGLLVDVKTTQYTAMPKREVAYQLLGYLLMDLDDRLGIKSIGFYLSRVPALITWPAQELLELVAQKPVDLVQMRAEFERVCVAAQAA